MTQINQRQKLKLSEMYELNQILKSVKSPNPWKSVIQTINNIITKGHGGELKVEAKMGEGSEFIIILPFGS